MPSRKLPEIMTSSKTAKNVASKTTVQSKNVAPKTKTTMQTKGVEPKAPARRGRPALSEKEFKPNSVGDLRQQCLSQGIVLGSKYKSKKELLVLLDREDEIKVKKVKDPNAPKRPLSGYMRFNKAQRELMKSKGTKMAGKDASKAIGELWSKLKQSEKDKYNREATEELDAYKAEKEQTKGPKRALSAYVFFCQEYRAKNGKGKTSKEIISDCGAAWNNIKETKKADKYKKQAEQDKVRYANELKEFAERMGWEFDEKGKLIVPDEFKKVRKNAKSPKSPKPASQENSVESRENLSSEETVVAEENGGEESFEDPSVDPIDESIEGATLDPEGVEEENGPIIHTIHIVNAPSAPKTYIVNCHKDPTSCALKFPKTALTLVMNSTLPASIKSQMKNWQKTAYTNFETLVKTLPVNEAKEVTLNVQTGKVSE